MVPDGLNDKDKADLECFIASAREVLKGRTEPLKILERDPIGVMGFTANYYLSLGCETAYREGRDGCRVCGCHALWECIPADLAERIKVAWMQDTAGTKADTVVVIIGAEDDQGIPRERLN